MSYQQKPRREKIRLFTRTSFFLLFILAPFLDIFRLDLTLGHFIIFGQPWTLGLELFQQGQGWPKIMEVLTDNQWKQFIDIIKAG